MLDFDLAAEKQTEFGVARNTEDGKQQISLVPVDNGVQRILLEMAQQTWKVMQRDAAEPSQYEPSEKHAATEYLHLSTGNDLAAWLVQLHNAKNLPIGVNALKSPAGVFCYFARFKDKKGRRLTGVRRAVQFKGVLKSRLVRLTSDALAMVPDKLFRLDQDFDLLIDSHTVHVLRPSGFEFVCRLQDAIMQAVSGNARAIAKELEYVEFESIESFASKHPRAARYLASIRSQNLSGIAKPRLLRLCKNTDVSVTATNGRIHVAPGDVMAFLEVLDRRRYEIDLLASQKEKFRATSRTRIG